MIISPTIRSSPAGLEFREELKFFLVGNAAFESPKLNP